MEAFSAPQEVSLSLVIAVRWRHSESKSQLLLGHAQKKERKEMPAVQAISGYKIKKKGEEGGGGGEGGGGQAKANKS